MGIKNKYLIFPFAAFPIFPYLHKPACRQAGLEFQTAKQLQ